MMTAETQPAIDLPAPTTRTKAIPGIYHAMPFEEYALIEAVNASLLKCFCIKTPKHAKAIWDGVAREDKPEFLRGTATHAALLEPAKFADVYAIGPEARRNSNIWKAFEAANPGKEHLKPSENADVIGMRDAVWADPAAAKLLTACDWSETVLVWIDEDTDLPCKARLDLYSTKHRLLPDVKTCSNIADFCRTADRLRYNVQLAWYGRGLKEHGLNADAMCFIVPEVDAPYDVVIFEPPPRWIAQGAAAADTALAQLAGCFESNDWPGWAKGQPTVSMNIPGLIGA